jgi:hypothetical protein
MLESFLDPLGKPMQIHEITKKQIDEGLADKIVGGLTNMAWKAAGTTNPLDQNGLQGDPTAGNLRQGAAGEMNKTLLAPLAKEMQKRWAQNVQQLLLKSVDKTTGAAVTSAAQIDRAALEKEFYLFLNALIGFDVGNIAGMDDGSGQAKQLDSELKPQITAAIANTQKPTPGADVWLPLATSVQRAKSISQFARGSGGKPGNKQQSASGQRAAAITYGPDRKPLFNGKPYNKSDPAHRLAVQQFGADPNTYVPQISP